MSNDEVNWNGDKVQSILLTRGMCTRPVHGRFIGMTYLAPEFIAQMTRKEAPPEFPVFDQEKRIIGWATIDKIEEGVVTFGVRLLPCVVSPIRSVPPSSPRS